MFSYAKRKLNTFFIEFNYTVPHYLKFILIFSFIMLVELILKGPYLLYKNHSEAQIFNEKYTLVKNNSNFYSLLNNKKILINKVIINQKYDDISLELFYDNIYYSVFENFKESSVIQNAEKILIEKNISYEWKKIDSFLDELTINRLILLNLPSVFLLVILLFILTKQGLLFNKDKFDIIYNRGLSKKERENAMSHLIGMDDIKKEVLVLKEMIENRQKFKALGIENTFNYNFSGYTGTGKTEIGLALAKSLGIPFIAATGNIETGVVGGGAVVIKNLFSVGRNLAKNHKSKMALIFLDEAQSLLVERGLHAEKWADDTANELLAQLSGVYSKNDGVDIIFIAASNFDDKNHKFDKAMMRRFQKKIFFRLPNLEERVKIYEYYINKIEKKFIGDIDFKYIAEISYELSPAHIKTIVQEASLLSLEKNSLVSTTLLELAYERIFIGQTDRKTTKTQNRTRNIVSIHELGHFICNFQNNLNHFILENQIDLKYFEKDFPEKHGFKLDYSKTDKFNLGFFHQLNNEQQTKAISYLKEKMNVIKISVESISQINALGYVLNKSEDESLKTRIEMEEKIVNLYGGLASEKFFASRKGDFSAGSSNDLEKISNMLDHMVNKYAMYSKYKVVSSSNIDLRRVNTKIICQLSDRFYHVSYENISQYEDLILYLQKQLIEKYVITLDDALNLIFEYYKEKS